MSDAICFMDMDGVLVNLIGPLCSRLGLPNPFENKELGQLDQHDDLADYWGLDPYDVWARTDSDFWAGLPKTKEADDILNVVDRFFNIDRVIILGSIPKDVHGVIDGKIRWLKSNYPRFSRRFLFGPQKWACAKSNSFLIDDMDYNVRSFEKEGGRAFLVARPWNSGGDLESTIVEDLEEFMNE